LVRPAQPSSVPLRIIEGRTACRRFWAGNDKSYSGRNARHGLDHADDGGSREGVSVMI
jgi:hypothetical protein